MEDEEDDFYDPIDSVPAGQAQNNANNAAPEQQDDYEYEEEEEVEDDDVWLAILSCLPHLLIWLSRMISISLQKRPLTRHPPRCKLELCSTRMDCPC
jgi:hypothetical protein